jgi:hypothetical protein
VEAVAIKENPIREITAKGRVTEDGVLHELDALVFATGFDAVDGNYRRMEILANGLNINDHWDGSPPATSSRHRELFLTGLAWCSDRTDRSPTRRRASRPRLSGSADDQVRRANGVRASSRAAG